MRKILLLSILVFFIFCTEIFAASPEELYRKGNLSYEKGNYEKAISLYEMLIDMDSVSPEVFYNLGNSYFKSKRLGKAILNYERALRLAPRDREVLSNLDLAKAMRVDKIDKGGKDFVLSLVLFPYEKMSINELTVLLSVVYFLIMVLLILSIFSVERKKGLLYTAATLAGILAIVAVFLVSKIHAERFVKKGAVIVEKVDVRSGPKEDYTLQFTLHEGTLLRVVEERQGWYEIELSRDLRGWLPKDSVEVI